MRTIKIDTRVSDVPFNCPICQAKTLFDVYYMSVQRHIATKTFMLHCRACDEGSVWKEIDRDSNFIFSARLVDPVIPSPPAASADMPKDVAIDYEEARIVAAYSPRSAAALLRLALQKLCKHFGEPGIHLDTDIRSLAKRPEFGAHLIKAADTLRIAGNNAVHPGEMDEKDIDSICDGLFGMLNLIVQAGITDPKSWDAIYKTLPQKSRKAAETKDSRS